MSDSQNWSSFDDEPVKKRPEVSKQPKDGEASAQPTIRPVDLITLRNRLIFGGLVGFSTGATFGGIDGVKLARRLGQSGQATFNSVAAGAASTGGLFAGFFLAYQGVKTVMQVQRGEDDLVNVGVATVAAGLPFLRSTAMRQNVPYALMLIALDHFHEEINAVRK